MTKPVQLVSDELPHQIRLFHYRLDKTARGTGQAQRIGVSCVCLCQRAGNGHVIAKGPALGYPDSVHAAWEMYQAHLSDFGY